MILLLDLAFIVLDVWVDWVGRVVVTPVLKTFVVFYDGSESRKV